MLAHITQKIGQADRGQPVGIVHHDSRITFGFEIQKTGQLGLDAFQVKVDLFFGQHLALGGLAAGIADQTGTAAGHGDGSVTELL